MQFSYKVSHRYLQRNELVPSSKTTVFREKRVTFWVIAFTRYTRVGAVCKVAHKEGCVFYIPLPSTSIPENEVVDVWLFASNAYPLTRDASYVGDYTIRAGSCTFPFGALCEGKTATALLLDTSGANTGSISLTLERVDSTASIGKSIPAIKAREVLLDALCNDLFAKWKRNNWLRYLSANGTNAKEIKAQLPITARHQRRNVPIWLWLWAHDAILQRRSTSILEAWTASAMCFSDAEYEKKPPLYTSLETTELSADLISLFPRSLAYVRDGATRGLSTTSRVECDEWLHPEFHPEDGIMGIDCEDAAVAALHTAASIRTSETKDGWLQAIQQREKECITFFAVGTLQIDEKEYTWHAYLVQLDAAWIMAKANLNSKTIPHSLLSMRKATEKPLPASLIECTTAEGATLGLKAVTFNDATVDASISLPQAPVPPLAKGRAETLFKNGIYPHTTLLYSPILTEYLGVEHIMLSEGGKAGAQTHRLLTYDDSITLTVSLVDDRQLAQEARNALIAQLPPRMLHRTPGKALNSSPPLTSPHPEKEGVLLNVFYREVDYGPWTKRAIQENFKSKQVLLSDRVIPVNGKGRDLVNIRVIKQ